MVLRPEGLSAADYEALPEEVCRRIEVIDGAIVVNAAPRRPHQRAARRLANALEEVCGRRFAVDTDVDLRLRDVPLLNRRPDIVVYDGMLPDDAVLRPQHCLLVVEIMSPGSITTDQTDKPAEYAASEIPYFWRIESAEMDEKKLTVFRYRLDPTTRTYAVAGVDTGTLLVTDPFDLSVDLADLT
ncbi:Uma2 family endonuclease [Actinokineospora sp. HBU206404]|uniref:Uma2 family endonuclease n=2 Tax=Actinokineospora xionganensis TaxID=2684470 RepID=A0ABR7L6V6_9PSEU|nr:Uma2 family endonuclease [Actinokineospora xionganensis]